MTRAALCLVFLALFSSLLLAGEATPPPVQPPAQPAGPDPAKVEAVAKFLVEAQKVLYSARRAGMNAFTADVQVEGQNMDQPWERGGRKGLAGKLMNLETTYTWSEGEKAVISIKNAQGEAANALQKNLRDRVADVWRGISGDPFDPVENENLWPDMTDDGAETEVFYGRKDKKLVSLRFDKASKMLLRVERFDGQRTTVTKFAFTRSGEMLLLTGMTTTVEKGNEVLSQETLSWGNHKEVSGRPMPASADVDVNGNVIKVRFSYLTVNGTPAVMKAETKTEVKDLATILAKAFKGNDVLEKQAAIQAAKDAGTDNAALLLSKYVTDSDAGVDVAKALGSMGKAAPVPNLIAALAKVKENLNLHEAICWALGQIGDPRAVGPLANNIWSGAGSAGWVTIARAKIEALGGIRCHASVDELLDMLQDSGGRWNANHGHIRANVYQSLQKLTGERFGNDPRMWKEWWKKNKASFRF